MSIRNLRKGGQLRQEASPNLTGDRSDRQRPEKETLRRMKAEWKGNHPRLKSIGKTDSPAAKC